MTIKCPTSISSRDWNGMIERKGNMFASIAEADAIFVTSNGYVNASGLATMGRGCAAEAVVLMAKRGVNLKAVMGEALREHGNVVNGLLKVDGTLLFSFPVKSVSEVALPDLSNVVPHMRAQMTAGKTVPGWACMARPELVERSAHQAMMVADILQLKELIIPRPGCGAGGLSWDDIGPLLHGILDDRFISTSWGSYEKGDVAKKTTTGVIVQNAKTYKGEGEYIGRSMPGRKGSVLGNPYKLTKECPREEGIKKYTELIEGVLSGANQSDKAKEMGIEFKRLCQKYHDDGCNLTLICWCAPEACHGDVLARLIEDSDPPNAGTNVYVGDVKLAKKYTRIVHGGRGDYMEIDPADMCATLSIPAKEQYRITSTLVYYDWYECNGAKVYFQKKTVGYADYRLGMYYIDPKLVRMA